MKNFSKYLILPISLFSLLACSSKESVKLSRLTTPKLEKITTEYKYEMSQKTFDSYNAFAKKFSTLAINETIKAEGENSLGVSIPDAYLCLAITAIISSDEARNDVLNYLELENVEQLRTAVKEMVATLCTLYKNRENQLSGGYNLNSIWLDSQRMQLVKEKDEELYKDLEEIFDASLYFEALTSSKANNYLKENGLKDMPTPEIKLNDNNPPVMGIMSVYYCLDYYEKEQSYFYKQQYQSGTHKMDYSYGETTAKVDYIQQDRRAEVYQGSNFYGADSYIQNLGLSYFLPNDKNTMPSEILEDVLNKNYGLKEGEVTHYDGSKDKTTFFDLSVSAPYFSLNNNISLEHDVLEEVLPHITEKGAGARLAESTKGYDVYLDFIKQFSVMKYNYEGFYSCSATIGGYAEATGMPSDEYQKFELKLDHPYIFEVNRKIKVGNSYSMVPLIIGEIVNPDYQD